MRVASVLPREDGPTEKTAVLRIVRPPIMPNLSDAEVGERIAAEVAAQEAAIRDDHARKQRPFLGVRAVLRQFPFDRPRSKEPRCELSPRVAAKDEKVRIPALRRLRAFLQAYRAALRLWCQGLRDVEFPAGTYAMRVLHCAACAPP